MEKISFQNGFIAGMATKGLVRSGELYRPICWNDAGVYSYFYIDFRKAMADFSIGMFNESIVVHDSVQLAVTRVQFVSTGVYKVTCSIASKIHGITVMNKKTSRLRFASGEQLPVFSTHFFVSGITGYIDACYLFDHWDFSDLFYNTSDSAEVSEYPNDTYDTILESTSYITPISTSDIASIVLT